MFRVTKDNYFDIWYIHKKFLFWWIKWVSPKTNLSSKFKNLYFLMEKGSYEFMPGEYGNYYYIVDKKQCTIEYFKNSKEFKEKYPEEFLKE